MLTAEAPAISTVKAATIIPTIMLAIIAFIAHLTPRLQFVCLIIFHPYIYYGKTATGVNEAQNTAYKQLTFSHKKL